MSAEKEFEKIIFQFAVEGAAAGGKAAVEQGKAAGVNYGHTFHFEDADSLRYLEENAIKLSKTSAERLRGNLEEVIRAGLKEGKPIREVTKDVRGVFENFKGYEAERIARTEIARGVNTGALAGYREMGIGVAEAYANAGACPVCQMRNGELFAVDKAMQVLPRHPNCYCFWIPRPDITSGNVEGWRSLGEISPELAKGLGLDRAFRRVCIEPGDLDKIENKSPHHLGYDRARFILETAERGFVDLRGDFCIIEEVEEGWVIIPVHETKTRGLQARTAYWANWSLLEPKLEKVKTTYGF